MGKTCSFFGHRSIIDDVSVKQQLYEVVEELIAYEDVDMEMKQQEEKLKILTRKKHQKQS